MTTTNGQAVMPTRWLSCLGQPLHMGAVAIIFCALQQMLNYTDHLVASAISGCAEPQILLQTFFRDCGAFLLTLGWFVIRESELEKHQPWVMNSLNRGEPKQTSTINAKISQVKAAWFGGERAK